MPPTFLTLPPEIRLQIYENLLITAHQPITIYREPNTPDGIKVRPRLREQPPNFQHDLSPSLLRTCKQIHSEATPILYSRNKLKIDSSHETVLSRFGPNNANHMTHLYMPFPTFNTTTTPPALSGQVILDFRHVELAHLVAERCANITAIYAEAYPRCWPWDFLQGFTRRTVDSEEAAMLRRLSLFTKVYELFRGLFPRVETIFTPEMDVSLTGTEYQSQLEGIGWTVRFEKEK